MCVSFPFLLFHMQKHIRTYTMLQINIKLLCLSSIQFVMITLRILAVTCATRLTFTQVNTSVRPFRFKSIIKIG